MRLCRYIYIYELLEVHAHYNWNVTKITTTAEKCSKNVCEIMNVATHDYRSDATHQLVCEALSKWVELTTHLCTALIVVVVYFEFFFTRLLF